MLVSLVPTHIAGVRQDKEALASAVPLLGVLSITEWPRGARTVRMANLVDPSTSQVHRGLVAPLFDVELVRMVGDEMWLVGYQIESTPDMSAVQYRQGWWVRLVPV